MSYHWNMKTRKIGEVSLNHQQSKNQKIKLNNQISLTLDENTA